MIIPRHISTKFSQARIDEKRVISDQDQLEALIKHEVTEADKAIKRRYQQHFKKNSDEKKHYISYQAYLSGILQKLVYVRNVIFATSAVAKHVEFLGVLGLTPTEILYALFTMGYKGITFKQIKEHLKDKHGRIKKLQDEYMEEANILKKRIFQDMASEVMGQEKKYLELLLSKLPPLQKALAECDPDVEQPRWNRLNKLITDIMAKCKDMHGVDLYRENVVKAQTMIAIQSAKPGEDAGLALPIMPRHQELEEGEEGQVIELHQDRQVIGRKEDI